METCIVACLARVPDFRVKVQSKCVALFSLLLVFSMICVNSSQAARQEKSEAEKKQEEKKTKNGNTVKEPPPPLFHIHHRGMHKSPEGKQEIDATPQSPPLEVDDPGVPDKGQIEINFTSQSDFSTQMRVFDFLLVDANYGTAPKFFGHEVPTQIKFEFPLSGAKLPGDPLRVGPGPLQFGLKIEFYDDDRRGQSVSLYPQIEFGFPGASAAEKNLANSGETLFLPLLFRREFRYFTLVANAGLNQPLNDPTRSTTGRLGFGLGRAFTRYTALMGEIRYESTLDFKRDRLLVVNMGVMRRIRDDLYLYANLGRSVYSEEGFSHLYAGIGVKFLISPKSKKSD